jgi:hypothetical protein
LKEHLQKRLQNNFDIIAALTEQHCLNAESSVAPEINECRYQQSIITTLSISVE